jgi:hypothetical protein
MSALSILVFCILVISSGILPTWHKRVHTCLYRVYDMYIICCSMYISYTWYKHAHTFLEIYEHVHTFRNIYKHVCTWYVHVRTYSGLNMYVHGSDMYVHVYTNFINMYIPCTNLYMQICTADVPCTDGYVHYLKCTDIVELCTYTDVFFFSSLFLLAGL